MAGDLNPSHGGDVPRLAETLSRAEQAMRQRIAAALGKDATVEQWRALALLADGRSASMSEIGERTLLPAPSLTRLVDRMVADNLVHRRADPADRRRLLVRITPRGTALHDRLLGCLQRDDVLSGLGTDAAHLTALLDAVIDQLQAGRV